MELSPKAWEPLNRGSDSGKGKGSNGVYEGGRRLVLSSVWILSSGTLADPCLHFLTNSIKRYQTCSSRDPQSFRESHLAA